MQTNQAEIQAVALAASRRDIPYSALVLSQTYQARTRESLEQDPEVLNLKASIKACAGILLHNLVVVDAGDGTYAVCAGGRRWTALGLLVAEGALEADHSVPCLVIPGAMAHFASLIENEQRRAMHPADSLRTYLGLREQGWTVEAIATANGVAELSVRKTLALANVAPSLIEEFRRDKIGMPTMQALASVSDHARQIAAYKAAKASHGHSPTEIRRFLAQTEMRGDTAVARYVTVAAYEKAGGTVRRDLFAEKGKDAYLDNPDLIHQLAIEKMQRSKLAKEVATEGWGWVDYRVAFDYEDQRRFGRVERSYREPTKAEAKQLAKLQATRDKLAQQYAVFEEDQDADEDQAAEVYERLEQAEEAIVDYRAGLVDYPGDIKPLAGVVIHLDYNGDLAAARGLIRQEDREAVVQATKGASAKGDAGMATGVDLPPTKTRPVHSAALIERMQAARVIALQAEVIERPTLALCLLIQQMLADVADHIENHWRFKASFDIRSSSARGECARVDPAIADSPAWEIVQQRVDALLADVPTDAEKALAWLQTKPMVDLVDILAVLTSMTIYRKQAHAQSASSEHADRIARAVDLDMANWWQPTAENYLSHVSKDRIVAVVTDAKGAETAKPLAAMKKPQAAAAAEELLAGTRWLPDELRAPRASGTTDGQDGESDQDEA